jgi:hypothetical protein
VVGFSVVVWWFGLEMIHVRHRLVVGARAVCSLLHCVLDFGYVNTSICTYVINSQRDFIDAHTLVCLGLPFCLGFRLRALSSTVDDY